jgi:carboxyl-terminal processing protease
MDKKAAPAENPDEWGVTPDDGLAVEVTLVELQRYEAEMIKLRYCPGKPDVVGPNPPPPPALVLKGKDGKPLWDDSKPFDDRTMNRALEHLRQKLSGLGAVPRVNPFPEMIAA